MNRRLIGVLVFALVVAGAASLLLYRLISARLAVTSRPAERQVLVASRNLQVGELLKGLDVRVVTWSGDLPPQVLTSEEAAVDRGVIANIYQGEPILDSRLAPKGAGAGLAATIPVGMRAAAVRVNEVVGLAGFATPGQRVDVLILGNTPGAGGNAGTMSKTLLQNIEVLSAGQQIQKDAEGKPVSVQVVNLLVSPEHAEVLSLASNDARIQLVLRNPLDTKEVTTPGAAMTELLGGRRPPPAQAPSAAGPRPAHRPAAKLVPVAAPPPPAKAEPIAIVVEVFHGGNKASAKFEENPEEK